MGKHVPTYAEKYAVWKHHGGRCFWCDEPVGFQEAEIDHFIPEHLENKPAELEKVRADYGLSESFTINDYCNWLPCHPRCNRKKGAKVPKLTLQAIDTLDKLDRDVETIRSIEYGITNKFKEDKRFAQVMVGLQTGLHTNKFTKGQKEEMKVLLADLELEQDEDIQILSNEIHIDVKQHYFDFLNRTPDPNGLAFWTNQITEGQQSSDAGRADRLVNASTAFFLSTEFYDIGYLVYRMYAAAYGSASGVSTTGGTHTFSVPIVRLSEFVPAIQQIGQGVIAGKADWQNQLETNKAAFVLEFVSRSRFTFAYPTTLRPAQFVDSLNANSGNPLSKGERDQLVSDLSANVKTRAQVLLAVGDNPKLISAEFNRAFVLMQYFGYLRRDPNETPDTDFSGYDYWLRKLNQFNGDYVRAEMVKAFIASDEYKQRFGS